MQHQKHLFHRLAEPLLEGYAWGWGAKENEPPYSPEALKSYARSYLSAELVRDLAELNTRKPDPNFIPAVDQFVDQHPMLEDIREILFDLAVLQVIEGAESEDFLESEAFAKIEEQAEERGTELLNLMIYIRDTIENEAKPALDDFLYEFLLVEEDDFQDEMAIYEPVVRNVRLVEEHGQAIVHLGNKQEADMVELFTPMMLFFKRSESKPGKLTQTLLKNSRLPHVHAGIYRLLGAAADILVD